MRVREQSQEFPGLDTEPPLSAVTDANNRGSATIFCRRGFGATATLEASLGGGAYAPIAVQGGALWEASSSPNWITPLVAPAAIFPPRTVIGRTVVDVFNGADGIVTAVSQAGVSSIFTAERQIGTGTPDVFTYFDQDNTTFPVVIDLDGNVALSPLAIAASQDSPDISMTATDGVSTSHTMVQNVRGLEAPFSSAQWVLQDPNQLFGRREMLVINRGNTGAQHLFWSIDQDYVRLRIQTTVGAQIAQFDETALGFLNGPGADTTASRPGQLTDNTTGTAGNTLVDSMSGGGGNAQQVGCNNNFASIAQRLNALEQRQFDLGFWAA